MRERGREGELCVCVCFLCVCVREREREREGEGDRKRERERERESQAASNLGGITVKRDLVWRQTRPGVEAKLVSRSPRYLPLAAEFFYCAQRSCGRRRRRRRRLKLSTLCYAHAAPRQS